MSNQLSIPVDIHQKDDNENTITLLQDQVIEWSGKTFTVPAGFESDGASVPRLFWGTVSPAIDPRTLRAALAHDYIYRTQPEEWTRAEADEMFYDFCREDGLNWWAAHKAYWGLRLFGGIAWKENQEALKKNDDL